MMGGAGTGADSRLPRCSLAAPTRGARVARWEQTALSCQGALFRVKAGVNVWNAVGVSSCAQRGTVPWALCYGITLPCNWNCIAALLHAALHQCALNGAALQHNKFSSLEKKWNYLRVHEERGLWLLHDNVQRWEVGSEAGGQEWGRSSLSGLHVHSQPFPFLSQSLLLAQMLLGDAPRAPSCGRPWNCTSEGRAGFPRD